MNTSTQKSSAEIQREIDDDRRRIGDRLDAIQERMSPGQLLDEVIAYAKSSGGAEYASNLGKALKSNPVPVALMGVSLAWLMAKQGPQSVSEPTPSHRYPLYPVEGSLRRLGPPEAEGQALYSHFADSSGKRFKALTDEAGRRAGDFVDEAGKTYRGFADATGKQIDRITDESGALLEAASGWISGTWGQVKDMAGQVGQKTSETTSSLSELSAAAGASVQEQAGRLNELILTHFRDRPLVGGALAFAAGAAIGTALPHTDKEDEVLGEAADAAKDNLSAQAAAVVDQGKGLATDAYEKTLSVASDIHDAARERVADEMDRLKGTLSRQDN